MQKTISFMNGSESVASFLASQITFGEIYNLTFKTEYQVSVVAVRHATADFLTKLEKIEDIS